MDIQNLPSGEVFQDRYVILQKLGESGHSYSYQVRDKLIGRDVALEIFDLEEEMDEQAKSLFIKDITIAGKLVHPVIRLIYTSEIIGSRGYISQEFIRGYNLRRILDRKPVYKPEIAAFVVSQVGQAIQYAHQRNILHKHVQPRVIYITDQGRIKLSDFGRHRFLQHHLTMNRYQDFKPPLFAYNAPELFSGDNFSPKTDIYSLGVTLYEMLCGRVPYQSGKVVDFIEEVKRDSYPSPHRLNPNVSPELDALIMKAISSDPDKRFSSLDEMLSAIEPHLVSIPTPQLLEGLEDIDQEFGSQPDMSKSVVPEERVVHVARQEQGEKISEYPPPPDVNEVQAADPKKQGSSLLSKAVIIMIGLTIIAGAGISASILHKRWQVQSLLTAGDSLLEQGILITMERTGAFSKYQEVLRIDQGNEYAREKIKDINEQLTQNIAKLRQQSEFTEALRQFDLFALANPDYPTLQKLREEIQNEDYLKKLSDEKEQVIDVKLASIRQSIEQKQYGDVESALREILNLDPRNADALLLQGDFYAVTDRFNDALSVYRDFSEFYPNRHEGLTASGGVYRRQNDLVKAEQFFRLAIERQADAENVHFNLAGVLQQQGKTDQAIEEYLAEIIHHDSAFAHFNLGYLYHQKQDMELAIQSYTKAMELKPDLQVAYYNLGSIFFRLERYQEAHDILEKVLVLYPDYFKAKSLLERTQAAMK